MTTDLELKVTQEQVLDFFQTTAPKLAADGSPLLEGRSGHWNFYLTPTHPPLHASESILEAIKRSRTGAPLPGHPEDSPFLPVYEAEVNSLLELYKRESRLFCGMMDDLINKREVSQKATTLFALYSEIMGRANAVKTIFDSQAVKPQRVTYLMEGIQEWVTAREKMYNPQTRKAYLDRSM